jgi:hypothetical protein
MVDNNGRNPILAKSLSAFLGRIDQKSSPAQFLKEPVVERFLESHSDDDEGPTFYIFSLAIVA